MITGNIFNAPRPIASFLTGSTLVKKCKPSDRDVVHLFSSVEEINAFASCFSGSNEMYGDSRFLSIRNGRINHLCTADVEFFYRFKAYSGALAHLQLEDKRDRVELAKACLYWEGPTS